MKQVLIISPHYPPVNAADMHRVRQSLPYFRELGWEVEVIAVDSKFVEANSLDELLLKGIPNDIKVHYVKAWEIQKSRKFGLGSLSMRSWFHFKKKGNELLKSGKFDLIYFSTTAFHVMALGPYWKRKFKIPFILDIQDPWRNDFYLNKPKSERPPKFFISYNIDKYLERKTIPFSDGIISVSQGYIDNFIARYENMGCKKFKVIPFGINNSDFDIMRSNVTDYSEIRFFEKNINIVYVGRGGYDLGFAVQILFGAFLLGLSKDPGLFKKIHFWFLGTSYAAKGLGTKTILPVADKLGVAEFVTERTDRLSYFETLFLLSKADILFMPGSIDKSYTASKLYPYIVAKKPLLGIFYLNSSVVNIVDDTKAGVIVKFDPEHNPNDYFVDCLAALECVLAEMNVPVKTDWEAFRQYSAYEQTRQQVDFFNNVIN